MTEEKKASVTKQFPKERNTADPLGSISQIIAIISIVIVFLPDLNPAHMTSFIRNNISLFTCGISWATLTQNMGRAVNQGWMDIGSIRVIYYGCLIAIIGAVCNVVNGCMSFGNLKFKRNGNLFAMMGGVLEMIASIMLMIAYKFISNTPNPNKVNPRFPYAAIVYLALGILVLLISIIRMITLPKVTSDTKFYMEGKYKLFLMFLPIMILAFLFSYLPLLGWRYAFFDYRAGETLSMDNFVAFKWFTQIFRNSATKRDIVRVLRNTLAMSGLGIMTSWIPLAFAIFLTEIKNNKFRRFVQSLTTIPNFISWVLVYAIALSIFSTEGFINTFLTQLTGDMHNTNYLMSNSYTWMKMLLWGIWKSLGWGAIVYISAISSIDRQLYEAAIVDGAGRFQKMWYITAPSLLPTYFVLLLMSIANILSNGMEQYLVFSNAMNTNNIQVLDLYVYNLGITRGAIPLSTVVGMMKTLISVILLFSANKFSKSIRGESIV